MYVYIRICTQIYICVYTFVFGDSKIMRGGKELISLLATKLGVN